MKGVLAATLVGVLCLLVGPTVQAQDEPEKELGFVLGLGFPDSDITGLPLTLKRGAAIIGARGALNLTDYLSLFGDLTVANYNECLDRSFDLKEYGLRIGPELLLPWLTEHSRFFLSGGLGWSYYDPNRGDSFDRGIVSIGTGVRTVTQRFDVFRWEVRLQNTITDGGNDWSDDFSSVHLLFGYSFGTPPADADRDGVPDRRDACPGTPAGAAVDLKGCPHDADDDGVLDGLDACPDTPKGATVDAKGCPHDADGDGVLDGLDACPNTPKGATVDAKGCPRDADGDGVLDGLDACPNTPKGATVDAKGCPHDADGDGVLDGLDRCPDTPHGVKVDANGCPLSAPVFEPGKRSLVLTGVNFDSDQATLTPASLAILDTVAASLHDWPEVKVEIAGHTDSTNTDAHNQKLSERRAQAVFDYLVSKGIGAARMSPRGYGESKPIADNRTPEGRAANRRIELLKLD